MTIQISEDEAIFLGYVLHEQIESDRYSIGKRMLFEDILKRIYESMNKGN